MAGVKAAGVAAHGHQAAGFGHSDDGFSALDAVSQGDFDLYMLARLEARHGLVSMHLGRCAENDCIDFFEGQAFCKLGRDVLDAISGSHFPGFYNIAAHERDHFNTVNIFNTVQVLDAECTCPCKRYF